MENKVMWRRYFDTEQAFVDLVKVVANKLIRKFVFDIHSREDLMQECFEEAIKGMENYNEKVGGIEPYLYTHLRNRLVNFKRDKSLRATPPGRKEIHSNIQGVETNHMNFSKHELEELIGLVPAEFRSDIFRLIDGVRIPKTRMIKIKEYLTNYAP